jgi:predicted dithiol-disulfide oxidoreductase (DUF899 family)
MFGPNYTAGCPSCSAIADGFNGSVVHLANHDVMLWAVSRAPLEKLQEYIFDLMGYHAFADRLTPMIVESLVEDDFIKKINDNVVLTENGLRKCGEIKERSRRTQEDTLKRLGLSE